MLRGIVGGFFSLLFVFTDVFPPHTSLLLLNLSPGASASRQAWPLPEV